MKFSIITATFNAEKHLNSCLRSIHSQLFDKSNFEHIIQDNCSTDRTFEIASEFPSLFYAEKDSGQSDGFNKAVRRARGEYVILLDADDILLPDTLRLYDRALSKVNADVIYGNILLIDQNDKLLNKFYSVPFNKAYLLIGLFCPPSNGICIRKDALINNVFDVNHHYNMDTEWFLRCYHKLEFFFVNEFVAKYRFHESNKTNSLLSNDHISQEIIIERGKLEILYRNNSILYRSKIIRNTFKMTYFFRKLLVVIRYKISSF